MIRPFYSGHAQYNKVITLILTKSCGFWIAKLECNVSCKNDRLTVFPNKRMEKLRTYHGLLHVLVCKKTAYLWACSVDGNYNLDSDEIFWLLDS